MVATIGLREEDLVAIRGSPGPRWPELLKEAWHEGAAVMPVDHRATDEEFRALIERARPTVVVEEGGALVRPRGGRPVDPDLALAVATSGTGGRPKVVELTHDAVGAAVRAQTRALGAERGDGWLCCLPPAHVGGLMVVVRAVLTGAPLVMHERFDPAAVDAEASARFVSVVPTMLSRLLDAGAGLERFRAILVGGAGLPDDVAGRARAAGARAVATYGLTETCGGVVYDGRPLEGTEVRVDARGEIHLRGPSLMRGYRLDPEGTADAFTDGGWLRTGDAGRWTDDGRLEVTGRLDDLIVTGGENVWPGEVEAILREHPGIRDVAVGGRPDPEWGSTVVAYVVPAVPGRPPSLDELRDFVAARLARYKAPRALVLAEHIPRTASGKVRRGELSSLGES